MSVLPVAPLMVKPMMNRQEWTRCVWRRIRLPLLLMLVGLAGSTRQLLASGEDSTLRVSKSGIYVIWYPSKGNVADLYLNQPYVVGGQIVLQWRDVEPAQGKYDFTRIDEMLADLEGRGLSTTIQINGNRKPDWLFEKVPYVKERLSHQVASRRGTLMYWHATHRDAYCGMLRALAVNLRGSPFRETILGLRLNFNAFGTEHTFVPPRYRSPDAWTLPTGVDPDTVRPWTQSTVEEYTGAVVDTYIKSFRATSGSLFVMGSPTPSNSDIETSSRTVRLAGFIRQAKSNHAAPARNDAVCVSIVIVAAARQPLTPNRGPRAGDTMAARPMIAGAVPRNGCIGDCCQI